MKIAIFDDHLFVINTLSDFLKQQKGVDIIGTATNLVDILSILKHNEVDVLLSDVLTDEEIGLSLFEQVKEMNLPICVVVYSGITSVYVQSFLAEYGVSAFVNKKEPLEHLWEIINTVYLNSPPVHLRADAHPPKLSPKEMEIAKYLAKGLAAKEIAALTNTSVNTINNQKSNLLLKFHCANSTELTLKLLQMGYLTL